MALINYEQQENNVKTLVSKLQAKGLNKNVIIALVVNSLHESYANPNTLEGSVNPGPPLGAQGTGPGGGLWQWTPYQGKITIGDWDGQINFMLSDSGQYIAHGSWWNAAGVTEPVPSIDSWDDFLHSSAGAVALTQQFIGSWERPSYVYGVQRYNQAEADVSEVSAYVTGNNPTPDPDPDPEPEPDPKPHGKDGNLKTFFMIMFMMQMGTRQSTINAIKLKKIKSIDKKYKKLKRSANAGFGDMKKTGLNVTEATYKTATNMLNDIKNNKKFGQQYENIQDDSKLALDTQVYLSNIRNKR